MATFYKELNEYIDTELAILQKQGVNHLIKNKKGVANTLIKPLSFDEIIKHFEAGTPATITWSLYGCGEDDEGDHLRPDWYELLSPYTNECCDMTEEESTKYLKSFLERAIKEHEGIDIVYQELTSDNGEISYIFDVNLRHLCGSDYYIYFGRTQ